MAASTTLGASTDGKASGELAILFSLNKCPGKDFLETSFGNSGVGRTSTTDAAGAVSGLMIRQSLGFPQPLLPGQVENLRVTHWTTNYRRYFLPNHHNYYFFLSGGLGAYSLSPGGKEFGLNFKAGVAIPLKGYKRWELEFSGSYHHLATSGPNLDFGNVLMGVQYRWGKHGRE